MFKIESYITPLLFSYVDKYVKLNPEDFKLSLWGGDVTLHKLDLRLDAIEKAIQLPIMVKSGHVHELKIHVPWTKLTSEPVVITINTMECIIKVREKSHTYSPEPLQKSKLKHLEEIPPPPPSYIESVVRKVINNASIVVNNLILKFTEDDIILSLNIKNMECFSVNNNWEPDIVDMTLNNYSLNRILNIQDLTFCLDKSSASGKIDVYEDPLFYRCSICVRFHMVYESSSSRVPFLTKADLNCERLNFSISNIQLPMLSRLIELVIAIYYGNLKLPDTVEPTENKIDRSLPINEQSLPNLNYSKEQQDWASWAWSYVPQILPIEEETNKRSGPTSFEFGMFCKEMCVNFKLREKSYKKKSQNTTYTSKVYMIMICRYISSKITIEEIDWYSTQFSICETLIKIPESNNRENNFFKSGQCSKDTLEIFYHNSLFDSRFLDGNSCITNGQKYFSTFNEQFILTNFSSFWFDYVYVNEISRNEERNNGSSVDKIDQNLDRESSMRRIITGAFELYVSADTINKMTLFYNSFFDNSYEPYSKHVSENISEDTLTKPTDDEDMKRLKCYTPMRTTEFVFHNSTIIIQPKCKKMTNEMVLDPKSMVLMKHAYLCFWTITIDKLRYKTTVAMYPKEIVKIAVRMPSLSEETVKHCHSNTSAYLKGVVVHLKNENSTFNIVTPFNATIHVKHLLFPEVWKNPLEIQNEFVFEIDKFTASFTNAQILLVYYTYATWISESFLNFDLINSSTLVNDSLLTNNERNILELSFNGFELRDCKLINSRSMNGRLESVLITVQSKDRKQFTQVLKAPMKTDHLISEQGFLNSQAFSTKNCTDFFKFTIQIPDLNENIVPSICFLNIEGGIVCFDTLLDEWLAYSPEYFLSDNMHTENPTISQASTASTRESPKKSKLFSLELNEGDEKMKENVHFYKKFPDIFRISKRTYLQINIENWLLIFNEKSLGHELEKLNTAGNAIVFCTPHLQLISQNHKVTDTIQDLPVHGIQFASSQEKLPWNIKVVNLSCYTITASSGATVIEPTTFSGTIAASAIYKNTLSDEITSLGIYLHVDCSGVVLSLSHYQIQLFFDSFIRLATSVLIATQNLKEFFKYSKNEPSVTAVTVVTNKNIDEVKVKSSKISHSNEGSGQNSNTETLETESDSFFQPADNEPKFSVWLQATAAKLVLKLLGKNSRVITELEDLTSSFDLQRVFSKINLKLGKVNVRHFYKKGERWILYSKGGLILNSYDSTVQAKKHSSQIGFMVVTITRALKRDLKKRLDKHKLDFKEMTKPIYLTEICLTLQPFDLVLATRLLHTLAFIFNIDMNTEKLSKIKDYFNTSVTEYDDTCETKPINSISCINSTNLPLLYVDTSNTRIFLLPIDNLLKECETDSGFSESHLSTDYDVIIFEINSIKILPRALNPLSRIVVEEDLYKRAVRASITCYHGSDIEDRQYQIDFNGFSCICSRWEENKKSDESDEFNSSLQNPALEWNTMPTDNLGENFNSSLSIINQLDIRLVLAPSIVYYQQNAEPKLVCGHSIEGCALSDVKINLNIEQIKLIYCIIFSNLRFVSLLPFFSKLFISETSSRTKTIESKFVEDQNFGMQIPVELLITANRISFNIGDQNSKIVINLIQPHMLIRCNKNADKMEISCFDAAMMATTVSNDENVEFQFSCFETSVGTINPKTGIPPALFTANLYNFLSPNCQRIEINFDRPMKISFCDKRIDGLLEIVNRLRPLINFKTTQDSPQRKVKETNTKDFTTFLNEFEVKSADLCIELYGDANKENKISISVLRQIVNFKKSVNCKLCYQNENFTVQCIRKNIKYFLIYPTELVLNCSLFKNEINMAIRLIDTIILFSENQYFCLNEIYTHWQKYLENCKSKLGITNDTLPNKEKSQCFVFKNYYDDLRNGILKYSEEESDNLSEIPLQNNIIFAVKSNKGALIWTYEEPRVISQLIIKPIPLRLFESSNVLDREEIAVGLTLQYFDECSRKFYDYCKFDVGENFVCHSKLLTVEERNFNKIRLARTWRIFIPAQYEYISFDKSFIRTTCVDEYSCSIIDPMSLVAAANLNSVSLESIQSNVSFYFECQTVTFQLDHDQSVFVDDENDFKLDTKFLKGGQSFFLSKEYLKYPKCLSSLVLNNASVSFKNINNKLQSFAVEITKINFQVVEYKTFRLLTMFHFNGAWLISGFLKPLKNLEINSEFKGLHDLNVNESIIHTLASINRIWTNFVPDQFVLLEYFIICNNTVHDLYIRQGDTKEIFNIARGFAFPFAWTCNSPDPFLKVSLDRCTWSESFTIDLLEILDNTKCNTKTIIRIDKFLMIVRIIKLSSYQVKIILDGMVMFANKLDMPIFIQMADKTIKLNGYDKGCSLITNSYENQFKIKFNLANSVWTDYISIKPGTNSLLKVPLHDRLNYVTVICHFIIENTTETNKMVFIVFTPLFIVQNDLNSSLLANLFSTKTQTRQQIVLHGQGHAYQLHSATNELNYSLTFQTGQNCSPSSPAVMLNSDVLAKTKSFVVDNVMNLLDDWYHENSKIWPYDLCQSDNDTCNMSHCNPPENIKSDLSTMPLRHFSHSFTDSLQSSDFIEDQISLNLKVELKPLCKELRTVLIKVVPEYLSINRTSIDMLFEIPKNNVLKFNKESTIATPISETFRLGISLFDKIYWSNFLLISEYDINSRFLHRQENTLYINDYLRLTIDCNKHQCFFIVNLFQVNNLNIICVKNAFILKSKTEINLTLQCLTVELTETRKKIVDEENNLLELVPFEKQPLLFWKKLDEIYTDPIFYIRLKSGNFWTLPIRLRNTKIPRRLTFHLKNNNENLFFTCNIQVKKEQTFIDLVRDNNPMFRFHNYCNANILIGEMVDENLIEEEEEILYSIPCILKSESLPYNPPTVDRNYPSLSQIQFKISFAIYSINKYAWSSPTILTTDDTTFVKFLHIPNFGDVKLFLEKHGQITQIFITSVTRFDLRAGQVRDRCGKKNISGETNVDNMKPITLKKEAKKQIFEITIDAQISDFRFTLSECHSCGNFNLISFIGNDVHISFRRFQEVASENIYFNTIRNTMRINVNKLILENERYGHEPFDFDIVFQPKSDKERLLISEIDILESDHSISVEKLIIECQPIIVQFEDILLYRILSYLKQALPIVDDNNGINKHKANDEFCNLELFNKSIYINTLRISEIRIVLSVHAQIKVFIATDQSTLKLSPFIKVGVRTTMEELIHVISVHYASSALLRAGHLIASLELLGSPSNLVRAFGNGFTDMIRLPIEGANQHGARGVVKGIASGMSSLVSNVSSATVNSITNFASSVARNMDSLAMDDEHRRRQEENRTKLPDGLGSGLTSGLSNLGLSLLSAIAGLADQPLRPIQDGYTSPGKIIGGIGKGLVGVIAKPIGGAAELISRSGKGLLRSVGFTKIRSALPLKEDEINYCMFRFCRRKNERFIYQTNCKLSSYDEVYRLLLTDRRLIILSENFDYDLEFQIKEIEFTCTENTILLGCKRQHVTDNRLAEFIGAHNINIEYDDDNLNDAEIIIILQRPKILCALLQNSLSHF